ncbi:class I SAM-dependent methyltransferase [Pleurocapsa sp. FMAR1]|uniref:tRNA (guanine-N1)-methyltransferase n=1 Tax=Pleurocapsa sp. FMAR1 TaxID=3040204 RepID=UPI0029C7C164|nr:tRNA (guanine-N1)-methyltransferase [Pleurocapsa sp. FMAR1]
MNETNWYQEESAKFQTGKAFYNPQSKLVRDLGVLAAKVYKQDRGSLRALDALAGCGIRSLRYWQESNADYVWVNEGNADNSFILQQNLSQAIASGHCQITHQDAHRVFFKCYEHRDYYDLVDVDCFGSAVPYLSTMLWATKIGGLMYLTSTDGRTLTGHLPENSIQAYGAIARSHPAAHEQALRLLIGSTQQQAATKGLGVEPVFSLFTGKTYRLMMRLVSKPNLTNNNYGFLAYCHSCGNYQTILWRKLNKITCTCSNSAITVSGAMWLGELHNPQQIERFIILAQQLGWQKIVELLSLMKDEIDLPPYFYKLGEIGRRGKIDIPKRSHLIKALQDQGYQAAATHINPQGIKTDADLETCIAIAIHI